MKDILLYIVRFGEVRRAHGCGAIVMGCFFVLIGRLFRHRRVVIRWSPFKKSLALRGDFHKISVPDVSRSKESRFFRLKRMIESDRDCPGQSEPANRPACLRTPCKASGKHTVVLWAEWRNGRRWGLKIPCPQGRVGSTPTSAIRISIKHLGPGIGRRQVWPVERPGVFSWGVNVVTEFNDTDWR